MTKCVNATVKCVWCFNYGFALVPVYFSNVFNFLVLSYLFPISSLNLFSRENGGGAHDSKKNNIMMENI